jgi:hypothetical protein
MDKRYWLKVNQNRKQRTWKKAEEIRVLPMRYPGNDELVHVFHHSFERFRFWELKEEN